MTGADFKAWRHRFGWTQTEAAQAIGMSLSQISDYENGHKRSNGQPCPVPRTVELATQAITLREEREYLIEELDRLRGSLTA